MTATKKPKKAQGTPVEVGHLEFMNAIIVVTIDGIYFAGKENPKATPQNRQPHWSLLHEGHSMGGVWKRGDRWHISTKLDAEKYYAVKNETRVWKIFKDVFPAMPPMDF